MPTYVTFSMDFARMRSSSGRLIRHNARRSAVDSLRPRTQCSRISKATTTVATGTNVKLSASEQMQKPEETPGDSEVFQKSDETCDDVESPHAADVADGTDAAQSPVENVQQNAPLGLDFDDFFEESSIDFEIESASPTSDVAQKLLEPGLDSQNTDQSWPLCEPTEPLTFSVLNKQQQQQPKASTSLRKHSNSSSTPPGSSSNSADTPPLFLEDFFDYESLCQDEDTSASSGDEAPSSPPDLPPASSSPVRLVPLCGYRDRHANIESKTVPGAAKLTSRRLLAAWKSLYPDIVPGSRQDYAQTILLAAASFNQTSLMWGRVRETMVPASSL